jgi:hypothetical protein
MGNFSCGGRRRLAIGLAGLAVGGAALFGAAAFAGDDGDINTVRVLPGPTTPAEAAAIAAAENQVGADYVASPDVQFIRSIKLAADGVGARVVGHYLYVTSTKDLEIYDVSTPADPQLLGTVTIDVEFENEQVPTNGSVLGISGQTPSTTTGGFCPSTYPLSSSGCLVLFDVRDKSHPVKVATVSGAGDHTSTCILDCTYMYGSAGSITDLRGVLGPTHTATKLGTNWSHT